MRIKQIRIEILPSVLSRSCHREDVWHVDVHDASEALRCDEDNDYSKLALLEEREFRMKEPEVLERIKMGAGPYKLQRSDLDDLRAAMVQHMLMQQGMY